MLSDEKIRCDNEIKQIQSENIKGTAVLRAEISSKIQKLKQAELERIEETQQIMAKDRDKLLANHALALEIQDENHKKELNRLQVIIIILSLSFLFVTFLL